MKITILGSGSSGGVPRIGNNWGACDPAEPKNRRSRCSLLVQQGSGDDLTSVLVDTSPDLRQQLLDADVKRIDGVLYTHDHADQTHGIDDLRVAAYNQKARIDVYADAQTQTMLRTRFLYCFHQEEGSLYPPILTMHDMPNCGETVTIHGAGGAINAVPFLQDHGPMTSLGFRFGPVAYSSDVVGIPDETFATLEGIDCWILDALRYTPHPTHAHLDLALTWVERVKPKRAILTNLHNDMDYQTLKSTLPDHIEPAYDGMVLHF